MAYVRAGPTDPPMFGKVWNDIPPEQEVPQRRSGFKALLISQEIKKNFFFFKFISL